VTAILRLALVVATLALGLLLFAQLDHAGASIFFLTYGGIGGYLIVRRPFNPIGWLLLLIGSGIELGAVQIVIPEAGQPVVTDLVSAIAVWGSGCGWSVAFLGVLCVSLVFPEGRLPSGSAGQLGRLAMVAMVVLVLAVCLNPVSNIVPVGGSLNTFVPNPLAVAPDAGFWQLVPSIEALHYGMLVLVVLGLGAMLSRARSAMGMVRLQYRWLIAALLLVVLATAIWAVAVLGFGAEAFGPAFLPVLFAYPAVPAAIAVAVLRYRLYEIDRIISRSLSWAIVTGVLVAAFAALVVGLQAVLSGITQGQTIAVAASTLAAFALFQPVRQRVQRAVDRRFDRARYDGELTAAAFADRLRTEVDLEAVASDLTGSVERALRPSMLALWLKGTDQ
jgi:hypothetical protein